MSMLAVIVYCLLYKGHEVDNLQKECLFLFYYHFPIEDFDSESIYKQKDIAIERRLIQLHIKYDIKL